MNMVAPLGMKTIKSDEFTIFQAFSVLQAKRVCPMKNSFITSGCSTSTSYPSLQKEVLLLTVLHLLIQYHRYLDKSLKVAFLS